MKAIYLFDIRSCIRGALNYVAAGLLLCFGLYAGTKFNLSAGEGIYLNSPYTVGFMLGLLSLSIIFIATVAGTRLLFKEWDARFYPLLFSTTITKEQFTGGRFLSFYLITFTGFFLLSAGFMTGQLMRGGADIRPGFHLVYYLYPLFLFGCINTLFVCSVLSLVAWSAKNKLMVAVIGLMLYVLYMIVLLFSSSPFMAQSTPQSVHAQQISALADPFGLSAYFFESRDLSVTQRNSVLTPLTGSLLINRLLVAGLSLFFLLLGKRSFSLTNTKNKHKRSGVITDKAAATAVPSSYRTATTVFNFKERSGAVLSFVKTDITYIFKSIPIAVTAILLVFYLGMEMYAEIEKGIRLPQKFAGSGLMASTILANFHLPGVLLVVYYANDLYWRSSVSRFSLLENAAALSPAKLPGHWLSASVLILFFSMLAVLQGLVFQFAWQYPHIDLHAYWGVVVFNSCPLILLAGFVLLMNRLIPNKYMALGFTLAIAMVAASPLANNILSHPLLRVFTGFKGAYSDFNGYGPYLPAFARRILFGFSIIVLIWLMINFVRTKKVKWQSLAVSVVLSVTAVFFAVGFMKGYEPKDKRQALQWSAGYEKRYRQYQSLPQPAVTRVTTQIHLYPSQNRYEIEGVYILKNQADKPVQQLLVNFDNDLKIEKAEYIAAGETINITAHVSELRLRQPMAPQDSTALHFRISYAWQPVNGHRSFNAIIENGSFMRISRYYPQIGYQSNYEIQDESERKELNLGTATTLKKLAVPRAAANDFINLDMTIDTEEGQTAAGSGDLVKEWTNNGRHYFHYKAPEPVPFRFAVSSANYITKSILHDSVKITVLYHPKHEENVAHLIRNAKNTLDYCRANFGAYPYKSVTFAEVSSFTSGFAATAYPAAIFMTEDMIFHANIKADKQQDVINELAGHELSHLWWGGNQIAPDEREGAAMLTETLAMYTEMMLYKKMYGKAKLMERVKMHQQIYDAGKGFSTNEPLYKVTGGNTHISYSKGAVVMVQLSELIGEQKVNAALRNLIQTVKRSGKKPVSTDLINEVLKVSEMEYHGRIKRMFMETPLSQAGNIILQRE